MTDGSRPAKPPTPNRLNAPAANQVAIGGWRNRTSPLTTGISQPFMRVPIICRADSNTSASRAPLHGRNTQCGKQGKQGENPQGRDLSAGSDWREYGAAWILAWRGSFDPYAYHAE